LKDLGERRAIEIQGQRNMGPAIIRDKDARGDDRKIDSHQQERRRVRVERRAAKPNRFTPAQDDENAWVVNDVHRVDARIHPIERKPWNNRGLP
jgi:hypothetical protein